MTGIEVVALVIASAGVSAVIAWSAKSNGEVSAIGNDIKIDAQDVKKEVTVVEKEVSTWVADAETIARDAELRAAALTRKLNV
jgi:hypothetical protein